MQNKQRNNAKVFSYHYYKFVSILDVRFVYMPISSNSSEQLELNQIDKLKTSKLSGNGAGQKQDQMTTKIKYKAKTCRV